MTDLPIKVLSRDEVEINGEKWKRSYFESMSRVTPTGGNSACSKVGADEILRLMDAYGEPSPKWQPGMFAEDGLTMVQFKVVSVYDGYLDDGVGHCYPISTCRHVHPPKEEKPSQERQVMPSGSDSEGLSRSKSAVTGAH